MTSPPRSEETPERCTDCDAPLATQAQFDSHEDGCECETCSSMCWREWSLDGSCDNPIDWRTRALALTAKAALADEIAAFWSATPVQGLNGAQADWLRRYREIEQ